MPLRNRLSGTPEGQRLLSTKTVAAVDKAIESEIKALQELCSEGQACIPFLIGSESIDAETVDTAYADLRERFAYGESTGRLLIVLESGGGDIDAAYNLAQLFRRYGTDHLEVMVPRWAKSAATLLACSADVISMSPVAELGPVDPQITQMNPMEQRLEQFSPLHIESTLELIRNEYDNGHKDLAEGLMQRLQFPLTLGSFKKSLELSEQYLEKLLATRMLKGEPDKAKDAAKRLTEDYADHGFCIDLAEAKAIGLNVQDIPEAQVRTAWKLHELAKHRQRLLVEQRRKETAKKLKDLPQELLDKLPPSLKDDLESPHRHERGGVI